MDKLILVTGGGRSGKSNCAQQLAELLPAPRVFIATCQVSDAEMDERVKRHRLTRAPANWSTIEEPLDLAGALRCAAPARVVLVDCLTIWVNNLLYEAQKNNEALSDLHIASACRDVLGACRAVEGTVIMVTGEVGMGIVPENPLARLYRDFVGTGNQLIAAAADQVILVTCGISLTLKGK